MKFLHTYCLFIFAYLFTFHSLSATPFNSIPTLPASNFQTANIEGNRCQILFTKGDGERRIVVAKQGSAVTSTPINGLDYNHSATFGNGDQLAAGEFVISDGTASNISIFGLEHSTTYHFAIFEYNGSNSTTEYLTTVFLSGSEATLFPPTTQTNGVSFTNITGHSFTLNWTNGDGSGRLVLIKEAAPANAIPQHYTIYNSNYRFGIGAEIGTGNYTVYRGTGSSVVIDNLEPDITYHVAIFEYNGSSAPVFLSPGATSSQLTQSAPSVQTSNISFSNIEGNSIRTNFTNGNGAYRLVVAKRGSPVGLAPVDGVSYQASSILGNGDELMNGSDEFVVYAGISTSSNITSLEHSTAYFIKVFEYNGTGTNTKYLINNPLEGNQMTLSPPTIQVSDFTFTNVTGNGMTINWTNGNGSKRLILMKEGSAVDADPDQYQYYYASTNFGSGAEVGSGNYAVYGHTGSSVTVTGLNPNAVYHIAAFENNGTVSRIYFYPPSIANQQTVGGPSVPASNLNFTNIEGNKINLNWTKGNGSGSIIIASKSNPVTSAPVDGVAYTASTQFGMGDELAAGEFVVYNSTSSVLSLNNLDPSSTYYFRVFGYNGTESNTFYLTTTFEAGNAATLSTPTIQATNMVFSNLTPISVKLDFTTGNGARRIVVVNANGPVDLDPVDLQTYYSNSAFGSGSSQVGSSDNYVVYAHTGNSVNVTNLAPNITYHFAVYEYNGYTGPVYLIPPNRGTISLPFLPTVQASALNFYYIGVDEMRLTWTKGNGSKRIVLAKKNSPVDVVPVNGNDYLANAAFGFGDELGTGNFVVYNGLSNVLDLEGLELDTTYHFAIFEYSGNGVNATYLSPGLMGSQSTVSKPTIAPSGVNINNLTASSATISWTNGNGENRLVVLSSGQALNTIPQDGTAYNFDYRYGMGGAIGNGFVMYRGSGSSTNVTSLSQGTTYYISVFDYNGYANSPAYSIAGTFSFTTEGPPLDPTTTLTTSTLSATSLQLSWTNGSGQKRVVLAKQGAPVDGVPVDGFDYSANAGFGSGDELGSGNFVVYTGTGNNFSLFNLQQGQTYHFAVFEYNFNGVATRYLTVDPATFSTMVILPVEWLSFTAKAMDNGIKLVWETASETNNDYFNVEYSIDGQQFLSIAKIDGHDTQWSEQTYQFLHENIRSGDHYYRLRQVDTDGQFTYSSILRTYFKNELETAMVFPNPTNHIVYYSVQNVAQTPTSIQLFNAKGQYLRMHIMPIGQKQIAIDVVSLPSGTYYLKNTETSVTYSFIKG